MSDGKILYIPDLHADIDTTGVGMHMDGDRDAEMIIAGPHNGGEVYDGQVYRVTLLGEQNGVRSDVGFFLPVEELEKLNGVAHD